MASDNDRQKILALIERANRVEEEAAVNYLKHIQAAVDWFGLDKGEVEKIKKVLTTLSEDSSNHAKILQRLKKRIIAGEVDF